MKEYQNYLFDLYGTLVDIHTDEENPRLWQRMSRLLAQDGIVAAPRALWEKYEAQVRAREAEARKERGAGAEIDIGPVFASFYEGSSLQPDENRIAFLAQTFRVLSLHKLRLFPGG